jgi:membrane dipeptidase
VASALTLDEARALHASVPVIDLHADTAKLMDRLGYDLSARHDAPFPGALSLVGHVDLPRMREGGVAAQCFGYWTLPYIPGKKLPAVTSQIDALDAAIAKHSGELAWARTGAEIRAAHAAGRIAALGGIEGGQALDGNLAAVEMFARRGVRTLGLLHLWSNNLGETSKKPKHKDRGLTDFGRDVVRECERCGVIVDLAHINRAGFFDAVSLSTQPLVVTHTGVNGVHSSWRNLDDDQLRAVASSGGCIGIIFARQHLGSASLEAVVDHIIHVIDVAGDDVPALGSDFDGFVAPTQGLPDVASLPNLTVALSRRGVSPRVLEKILSSNALRVLDEVPAFGRLAG